MSGIGGSARHIEGIVAAGFPEKQTRPSEECPEDRRSKVARVVCVAACIGFAALIAWISRQYTNYDGISYLDMSDALMRHRPAMLINPYWGPLYPFLVGTATWMVRPSGRWELPLVHVVNFSIFLCALASFDFLLRQVLRAWRSEASQFSTGKMSRPDWKWLVLGYAVFALTAFRFIGGPRMVTPDLCVAAFVYLDAGLLLKLRADPRNSPICVALGVSLGIGYFAKAVLFPMASVFIAVEFFAIEERRRAIRSAAVTTGIFALVAGPLVVANSRIVGRPSFGEAGRFNYAWDVNLVESDPLQNNLSLPPSSFAHPMQIFLRHPDIVGFQRPNASTYPLWDDPFYWAPRAVDSAFHPLLQWREIKQSLVRLTVDRNVAPVWGLTLWCSYLFFIRPRPSLRVNVLRWGFPLFVPGATGLLIYALVVVELRYIGAFVTLIVLGLLPWVFSRDSPSALRRDAIVTLCFVAWMIALVVVPMARSLLRSVSPADGPVHYLAAETLNRDGVLPDEAVAVIDGPDSNGVLRTARLARVRVVAEMPEDAGDGLWRSSDFSVWSNVDFAFARSGARAVIADRTPPAGLQTEWRRVGATSYFLHQLPPAK